MARASSKTAVVEAEAAADNSPKSHKAEAFEAALALINKELKSDSGKLIAKLSERPMDVETIPSGSIVLDSILGGGFPRGRLVEIYGAESSGKTSMALTAVGHVQRMGGTAAFIDLENALDPKYAKKLGVDIDNLAVSQPDYAEQALNLVFRLTQSGTVDIIVVDSIASLVPKAELEADMEQQTIGLLARIMSKALKQLASLANKTGTLVIFINQTRDAVGSFSPYGTPTTTPGGRAMKFYASQRIEVKRAGQVKDGKDIIGNEVKMVVRKNKIAPPFGEGKTVLTYNKGINKAAEMIEVGAEYGVIEMPNNRTYVEAATGEIIAKSKADAVAAVEADAAMLERLTAALQERINNDLFGDVDSKPVDNEPDFLSGDEEPIFDEEGEEALWEQPAAAPVGDEAAPEA